MLYVTTVGVSPIPYLSTCALASWIAACMGTYASATGSIPIYRYDNRAATRYTFLAHVHLAAKRKSLQYKPRLHVSLTDIRDTGAERYNPHEQKRQGRQAIKNYLSVVFSS